MPNWLDKAINYGGDEWSHFPWSAAYGDEYAVYEKTFFFLCLFSYAAFILSSNEYTNSGIHISSYVQFELVIGPTSLSGDSDSAP